MAYKQRSAQVVVEGGTGVGSNTAYTVLCGGTTTTGPVQSIAGVGTSGQHLTSNGAGALPTFQAAAAGIAGPGSSTDNALARWNGTGGDTLQDSSVIVDDNGIMINASQPAFLGYLSSTVTNLTGGGTAIFAGDSDDSAGLTEVFDQSSSFTPSQSGGADFEAPVTGLYHITIGWGFTGITSGMTSGYVNINASNRSVRYSTIDYGNVADAGTSYYVTSSILVDMDITDTVTSEAVLSNATDIADITGVISTNYTTFFAGFLAC